MRRRTWKKWLLGALLVVVVVVLGSLVWVEVQLRRAAGQYTEVVDRRQFQAPQRTLAIVNVSVLAADGGRMIPGQTVLVEEGRIVSVGAQIPLPPGAQQIDGSGRYLVPGLADMHVHLRHSPNDLLLYLANGVTHIAEMSGNAHHLAWREDTRQGAAGPRMFITSQKLGNWSWLQGHFQAWTRHRINLGHATNAEATVQGLASAGYDAVKLGTFVDAASYRAVGEAATAQGVPMVGHLPLAVELDALWASGQSQLAHIEELVKALNVEFGYYNSRNTAEFLAFVEARSTQIARQLRAHDIAVATTLWLIESIPRQKLDPEPLWREVQLAYVNPGLVEGTPLAAGWLPSNNPYLEQHSSVADRAVSERYWSAYAEAHRIVLRALAAEGVQVLAGTDADNAVVVPGFSLHDELQAMVDAGMSPGQALAAATRVPGAWLGQQTGRIVPGHEADLLLLRENPLADIAATRAIDAVVLGGRLFEAGQLQSMLAEVRAANDRSRSIALE